MADKWDSFEERQKRIRGGKFGPMPGTPAFGERARERRERLRQDILGEKPLSVEGRTKQIEYRRERDKKILEEAED